MAFSETIANQSYPRGQSIAPLTLPVVTAEIPPINYTLLTLSDLPFGLQYDSPNLTIHGTPHV
ncbi:MAG: hypothetical protein OXE59_03195 [Bacteroidetes bacterium]|nr:hypothetical protein [Bacteroidota bacterium]